MNTNTNRIKQWQEQEALSRFQLIAPLLQEDLDDAKRLQLRKQIAQDNDISVWSIYRYEKAYREGQFAGLKPATREKRRSLQTATFCGQQGRISRTVQAILSGQTGISAGQRVLRPTNQYCSLFQEKAMLSQSVQ